MTTWSLDTAIKLAELEPGDLLRSVAVRAATSLLDALPPEIAEIIGLGVEASAAVAQLQKGNVGSWLNLIQRAQERWIEKIAQSWATPMRCTSALWTEAANAFPRPPVVWSTVPLKSACGVGEGKGRKPGHIYWCAIPGCGPKTWIEEWSFDLTPTIGQTKHRQSWIPDLRASRQDGFLFCPATFPYCSPGEIPTVGPSEALLPVMSRKYLDLVMDGADQEMLDWVRDRILALVGNGRLWRDGQEGQTWATMKPVQRVQAIPMDRDSSYVYMTPSGEIWALHDGIKIMTGWETDLPAMTASVAQIRKMLGSLAGLTVSNLIQTKDPGAVSAAFSKGRPKKGNGKKGGGVGGGGLGELAPPGKSSSGGGAILGGLALGSLALGGAYGLYRRSQKRRRR